MTTNSKTYAAASTAARAARAALGTDAANGLDFHTFKSGTGYRWAKGKAAPTTSEAAKPAPKAAAKPQAAAPAKAKPEAKAPQAAAKSPSAADLKKRAEAARAKIAEKPKAERKAKRGALVKLTGADVPAAKKDAPRDGSKAATIWRLAHRESGVTVAQINEATKSNARCWTNYVRGLAGRYGAKITKEGTGQAMRYRLD